MDLVQTIYNATSQFPSHEKYGIVSQMTRAAVSIPSTLQKGQVEILIRSFVIS